jgi:hypothetical protein
MRNQRPRMKNTGNTENTGGENQEHRKFLHVKIKPRSEAERTKYEGLQRGWPIKSSLT